MTIACKSARDPRPSREAFGRGMDCRTAATPLPVVVLLYAFVFFFLLPYGSWRSICCCTYVGAA